MEYEELRGNDREFKNSSRIYSNVNRAQNVDIAPRLYNIPQFQKEILKQFFQAKNIIMNSVIFPKCRKSCNLIKQNSALDNKVW